MSLFARRCSALVVAGTLAVTLASTPSLAVTVSPAVSTVQYTDMDDFSSDARYAPFYTQKIAWGSLPCPTNVFGTDPATQECAHIVTPKDWKNPELGTLKVAVGRNKLSADQQRSKRVLMSNNGGPGGPGMGYSSFLINQFRLGATHDALDVDPRGVGLSTANSCTMGLAPRKGRSGPPTKEELLKQATSLNDALAACDRAPDSVIPYMDSVNTARDFNLVRHLAGYSTADYFGTSYGTWLGSILGRMFPLRFERVVLDSNVDVTVPTLAKALDPQQEAYQWSLDRGFVPWLARHHGTYSLGSTPMQVHATVDRLMADADAGKLGPLTGEDVRITVIMALRMGQYGYDTYGAQLAQLNRPGSKNLGSSAVVKGRQELPPYLVGAMYGIRCNDSGPTASLERQVDDVLAAAERHPLAPAVMSIHPCANWPRPNAVTPDILARPFKALLTQNEDDSPTASFAAVKGALTAAGGSRMALVDDGHGHGAWAHSCTRALITRLFAQGEMPAKHVYCQAGPLPLDDVVYEFGAAATDDNPLPVPNRYLTRDVNTPLPIDTTAPTGTPATPRGSQPTPRRLPLTPWFPGALLAGL